MLVARYDDDDDDKFQTVDTILARIPDPVFKKKIWKKGEMSGIYFLSYFFQSKRENLEKCMKSTENLEHVGVLVSLWFSFSVPPVWQILFFC